MSHATAKFAFSADANYPQTMSLEPGMKVRSTTLEAPGPVPPQSTQGISFGPPLHQYSTHCRPRPLPRLSNHPFCLYVALSLLMSPSPMTLNLPQPPPIQCSSNILIPSPLPHSITRLRAPRASPSVSLTLPLPPLSRSNS